MVSLNSANISPASGLLDDDPDEVDVLLWSSSFTLSMMKWLSWSSMSAAAAVFLLLELDDDFLLLIVFVLVCVYQ